MATKSLVQRNTVTITNGDPGNSKDFLLTSAVKLGSAIIVSSVMENRAGNIKGAIARILDATHVRVEWLGALAGGESIVVSYEVYDVDDIADDLLEVLFRQERTLGLLGENVIQDLVTYNDAGVMTSYRLRLFNSKANALAATMQTTGGFETGETARILATKEASLGKNDVVSLRMIRDDVITTPGIS